MMGLTICGFALVGLWTVCGWVVAAAREWRHRRQPPEVHRIPDERLRHRVEAVPWN